MISAQQRHIVLTRAQAKVLSDIRLFQDKSGQTKLSVRTLSQLTRLSRMTVCRSIKRLNRIHVLRTLQGNSTHTPTVHRVLFQGPYVEVLDPKRDRTEKAMGARS